MKIRCVWEHNRNDSILYSDNFVGAFTRGETRDVAIQKMPSEIMSYLKWKGEMVSDSFEPVIVQEKESDLTVSEALSNGKAQFMILKEMQDMWNYEFVSLDDNIEDVIADLHSSGLNRKAPYWCKISENLLRTGEISHGTVLARAMTLCKDKFGECNWPNIPEECWAQATKELM